MSRILEYIRGYDEALTVGELRRVIELEEISAKQIETEKINKVKEDFKDVYLKRIYDCDLFGETLQVFHIEEIVDTGKDENFETFYYYKGTKLFFGRSEINFQIIDEVHTYHSFTEEDLRKMIPLTKDGYYYYKTNYNEIRRQLDNLIGL